MSTLTRYQQMPRQSPRRWGLKLKLKLKSDLISARVNRISVHSNVPPLTP